MSFSNVNYPLINYNFLLQVDGKVNIACKSVSGIKVEAEYEYIVEGGQNDYPHMIRKQNTKPSTFTIERYVTSGKDNPLVVGNEFQLPLLLMVSTKPNSFENVRRKYAFSGCTVTNTEYGSFEANQSGLLTEKVTITYQSMVVVDNEVQSENLSSNAKNAKTTSRIPKSGMAAVSKKQMEQKARQWPKVSSAKKITDFRK